MEAEELKRKFIEAFKEWTHCPHTFFLTEKEEEKVIDSAERQYSCFGCESDREVIEDKFFGVHNPATQKICLWAIDNKLIKKGPARCDCALFSSHELCFVEFKANATSTQSSAVENNYRKAYSQLKETATLIITKSAAIGFDVLAEMEEVEAYMVKSPTVPAIQASEIEYATRFIKEMAFDLKFESEKTF